MESNPHFTDLFIIGHPCVKTKQVAKHVNKTKTKSITEACIEHDSIDNILNLCTIKHPTKNLDVTYITVKVTYIIVKVTYITTEKLLSDVGKFCRGKQQVGFHSNTVNSILL